jgi:hypothetical protein
MRACCPLTRQTSRRRFARPPSKMIGFRTGSRHSANEPPTSTDQAASITAGQEPTTRSTDQTAATIGTGQGQMTRNTDQTPTSIDQAPSKAISIPVERGGDAASLQPTVRSNIKPTEAKPPQTLSEKGKPLSAASGHDPSCYP